MRVISAICAIFTAPLITALSPNAYRRAHKLPPLAYSAELA